MSLLASGEGSEGAGAARWSVVTALGRDGAAPDLAATAPFSAGITTDGLPVGKVVAGAASAIPSIAAAVPALALPRTPPPRS